MPLNVCDRHGWARPKPGARQTLTWVAGAQLIEHEQSPWGAELDLITGVLLWGGGFPGGSLTELLRFANFFNFRILGYPRKCMFIFSALLDAMVLQEANKAKNNPVTLELIL